MLYRLFAYIKVVFFSSSFVDLQFNVAIDAFRVSGFCVEFRNVLEGNGRGSVPSLVATFGVGLV